METSLLEAVKSEKKKVCDEEAQRAINRELSRQKNISNAEEAYKQFEDVVKYLDEVESIEIASSHIVDGVCPVITDIKGRKFEIHYNVPMFNGSHFGAGDSDYRVAAQWGDDSWYTFSVFMSKFKVAQTLGRWLAQTNQTTALT